MISFHIKYNDGTNNTIESKSFEGLVSVHFGTHERFRERVEAVMWKEKSTLTTYSSETDEFDRKIADGDVNPFGWRMQHR
jgi:hypothetical protein